MATSAIEWTDTTWNPVTGCKKISAGCVNCYAEKMAKRLCAMKNKRYSNGFQVTCHHDLVDAPLKWRKKRMVFVNSMSDIFHQDVPCQFICSVFETMNKAIQHRFQVLTKRPERLDEIEDHVSWSDNIWMGVTVENRAALSRMDYLRRSGAKTKFLSIEPLLEPLGEIDLRSIDWVIVGGESGPGYRPMEREWVTEIRDQCIAEAVPFFFKQWGTTRKKKAGRLLDGRIWNEFPA
ncbi:MAG: phage Gp37/Gp68 family protein [Desulfobulbaceae bacterium]|nr:phage Gp37/Gp68 family protein [Desulfobulbaceae bacterium]